MYINKADIQRGMRPEVLETLTRGSYAVVDQAIAEAEAEVAGYLAARYDIATELAKAPDQTPDTRLTMVLKLVRDVAIFNIHNFTAPVNIPENRRDSYNNAIALLKSVQGEKASINGLQRISTANGTTTSSYIQFGTGSKRDNNF